MEYTQKTGHFIVGYFHTDVMQSIIVIECSQEWLSTLVGPRTYNVLVRGLYRKIEGVLKSIKNLINKHLSYSVCMPSDVPLLSFYKARALVH